MSERPGDPVEVLSGSASDGLRWLVEVTEDDGELMTILRVYAGAELVVPGSGFGGPKLQPGLVLTAWHGRTDDLPYFVMARTAPSVDRVVATTDQGLEVELALSAPVEALGLRFAAAALPAGHRPGSIRAERAGAILGTMRQRMPPVLP